MAIVSSQGSWEGTKFSLALIPLSISARQDHSYAGVIFLLFRKMGRNQPLSLPRASTRKEYSRSLGSAPSQRQPCCSSINHPWVGSDKPTTVCVHNNLVKLIITLSPSPPPSRSAAVVYCEGAISQVEPWWSVRLGPGCLCIWFDELIKKWLAPLFKGDAD